MAKIDGKTEILRAVAASGLQRDPRAKQAYKLPGNETWRLDLGGVRTARLERHYVGAWRGYSEPLYYGQIRSPEFAKRWVDWVVGTIRAGKSAGPEPTHEPTAKESRTKAVREQQRKAAEEVKNGPGYYVTNSALSGMGVRVANHGPYRTLDEAMDKAGDSYREYTQQRFHYLLPVEVVHGSSRREVERGNGYTWWINGKRKSAPAHPSQMRLFADLKPLKTAIRRALTPELLHEPYRSRVVSKRCDPMTGHCYVASEAAYHMLGGKAAGWTPMFVQHEGSPHWYLRGPKGQVLDSTASQFRLPVPYAKATAKGFLTREPSARARTVIERAGARR